MSFRSLYRHGFARVAACTTRTALADPATNAAVDPAHGARSATAQAVAVAVFPELGISGYAISDLLQQTTLLDAVEAAIDTLVAASADLLPLLLVGAPLRHRGRAVQLRAGDPSRPTAGRGAENPPAELPRVLRAAPFRLRRRHGRRVRSRVGGRTAPFGTDLLFAADDRPRPRRPCRDLRGCLGARSRPAARRRWPGATVLANLSASNITIGKAETRRLLCQSQSARCLAAYLYAAAGAGESTTDLAWDGQASVFENGDDAGRDRAVSRRRPGGDRRYRPRPAAPGAVADGIVRYQPPRAHARGRSARIGFRIDPPAGDVGLRRRIERFPFVPADVARLEQDCYEAYNIQVSGLAQRLRATGIEAGGDRRFRAGSIRRRRCSSARRRSICWACRATDILAYTMPGFATSRSHQVQCAAR